MTDSCRNKNKNAKNSDILIEKPLNLFAIHKNVTSVKLLSKF